MNIILVEKIIQMMAEVCEADGVQGSCYFYWFCNNLDDLLYKKEEEPLPLELCSVLGPLEHKSTWIQLFSAGHLSMYLKYI